MDLNKVSKMDELEPARDTTFDKVIPQRLWIGVTNLKSDKLQVIAEINGIDKVIWEANPLHCSKEEGLISTYTNLTWLFERYKDHVYKNAPIDYQEELEIQRSQLEEFRKRVRELEAVIQKRVDIETKSIEKYGAYFSDPMMNQYEIERKALKKEGI